MQNFLPHQHVIVQANVYGTAIYAHIYYMICAILWLS